MKSSYPFADRFVHVSTPEDMASAAADAGELGAMPDWKLSDLYPSTDAPQLKQDLERSAADADVFAERYQGNLGELAAKSGSQGLYDCLKEFEALQDRLGRIGSFAFLNYVTKVDDPARAKFFGDIQEKLTNIGAKLLFLGLEINRIEDALLERIMNEAPLEPFPALARGGSQGEALSALRRSRAPVP